MNTPTNHPVSQAEAGEALQVIARYIPASNADADTSGARDLVELVRRYIAQGAPEGQAVAELVAAKCALDDAERDYAQWRTVSSMRSGAVDRLNQARARLDAAIANAKAPHPIPRASAAGVMVPDEKEDLDPVRLHAIGRSASDYARGVNDGWNDCRTEVLRLNDATSPSPPTNSADIGSKSVGAENCDTCGGVGMVGGWSGQTAESGGYDGEDCPACTPAPPDEGGDTDGALFRVGDRVRVMSLDGYSESPKQGIVVGNTGTVTGLHAGGVVDVRTDNAISPTDNTGLGWAFYEKALNRIDYEEPTPARSDGGP